MQPLVNDRWQGEFQVDEVGNYYYTVTAWVNPFESWRQGFAKKVEAGQDVTVERLAGAELAELGAKRAAGKDRESLEQFAAALRSEPTDTGESELDPRLAALMEKYQERRHAAVYDKQLVVNVDRTKARFSTWYEMFPRSCAAQEGKHGTLEGCIARLPYVASMGLRALSTAIHPSGIHSAKARTTSSRRPRGCRRS
jgi:starch synthase (maltosyl-transferring)